MIFQFLFSLGLVGIIDVDCQPTYGFSQFNERPVAQTLEVGVSGWLQYIEIYASQLDPEGNLIVEIKNTVDGFPANGTFLAASSMPASEIPSSSPGGSGPEWVAIDFSEENLFLNQGDLISIVMHRDTGGPSSAYGIVWWGNNDDSCPGLGMNWLPDYWNIRDIDFAHRTIIGSQAEVPTLNPEMLIFLIIALALMSLSKIAVRNHDY